jgi:hypothetical protein
MKRDSLAQLRFLDAGQLEQLAAGSVRKHFKTVSAHDVRFSEGS